MQCASRTEERVLTSMVESGPKNYYLMGQKSKL
jgi:hypothetical protein